MQTKKQRQRALSGLADSAYVYGVNRQPGEKFELGYAAGVEELSRYLSGRSPDAPARLAFLLDRTGVTP